MTVCIGAVCTLPSGQLGIVGVSDRMLTVGDIEFEPLQQKVYYFGEQAPLAAILVSGDMAEQTAICRHTHRRMMAKPTSMPVIENIAAIYAEEYVRQRQQLTERLFLSPLGLTLDSFVTAQRTMAPEQVQSIRNQLVNYDYDAAAIVCGVDAWGAHLFTIRDPGVISCGDGVGFDAIGSGARHARSQFELAGYERRWPFSHALLHAYAAKRRAEAAPGVGDKGTDIIFIEPGAASVIVVSPGIQEKLAAAYDGLVSAEAAAAAAARLKADLLIKEVIAAAAGPAPASTPGTSALPVKLRRLARARAVKRKKGP